MNIMPLPLIESCHTNVELKAFADRTIVDN